jgi:hypothetical protein
MIFFTYKEVDGEHLYMKNLLTFKVLGFGKVIIMMTFKNLLILNNVLHVANIRKNLVFDSLLSTNNFKIVFKSDNVTL